MSESPKDLESLRGEYCPPIDDALFYAVSSEYELPKDHHALTQVLDEIKQAADQQDTLDFDPSGTGGVSHVGEQASSGKSISDDKDSTSHGVTSITTGLSDVQLNEEAGLGNSLESLSIENKEAWLRKVFPTVHEDQIRESIGRHHANINIVTDELLNLAFLSQEDGKFSAPQSPVLKSIDGFDGDVVGNARKPRGKRKKNRTNDSSRASSPRSFLSDPPVKPSNAWEDMSEAIQFICSRTNLPPTTVKSVYHANGAQLPETIRYFASEEGKAWRGDHAEDLPTRYQIAELKDEFHTVSEDQIYGVFVLTGSRPYPTHDLLRAMTVLHHRDLNTDLKQVPRYMPLKLENDEDESAQRSTTPVLGMRSGNARELATVNGLAAGQAFSQAAAAYKRGKSDRLMGGAAAYYSSVGHERMRAAKELQSFAADDHVAAQSSTNILDLHGVSVADAVRMARSKTQAWWESLGDAKYAPGGWNLVNSGYKIVTGVGSHSRNHSPRIGPAVSKMLVREGWRVEIGHGELIVTGKVRK